MIKAEEVCRLFEQVKQSRSRFEPVWDEIRAYAMSTSKPIYGETYDPDNKDRRNYDSTAEIALRNLVSVLMSSITNPSTRWVQLESTDEEMNRNYDAKAYFEEVEKILTKAIENSNAYPKIHEFYKSLGGYGTGGIFIDGGESASSPLNFRTIHISELYIAEDHTGKVDTVFRYIKMSVRDILKKFKPAAMTDSLFSKLEANPYEEIKIIHGVFPRSDFEYTTDGKRKMNKTNLPFVDVWIYEDEKHVLEEGGFRSFPYAIARWDKESSEAYGTSPVMEALADIRTLNRQDKATLQLAEKLNNPPKAVMGNDKKQVIMKPGAVNFFNEDTKIVDLVTGANYPITYQSVQDRKKAVMDALYVNQLQNISQISEKEMTAQEVQARQMENLRILGPVFSRIQTEFLSPFIKRCITKLYEDGYLPPVPKSLNVSKVSLRFVNPLVRAQKQDESQAIQFATTTAMQWAQVKPEIMDNLDLDKAYRYLVENTSIPLDILIADYQVEEIRAARAQQQQQQEQQRLSETVWLRHRLREQEQQSELQKKIADW